MDAALAAAREKLVAALIERPTARRATPRLEGPDSLGELALRVALRRASRAVR